MAIICRTRQVRSYYATSGTRVTSVKASRVSPSASDSVGKYFAYDTPRPPASRRRVAPLAFPTKVLFSRGRAGSYFIIIDIGAELQSAMSFCSPGCSCLIRARTTERSIAIIKRFNLPHYDATLCESLANATGHQTFHYRAEPRKSAFHCDVNRASLYASIAGSIEKVQPKQRSRLCAT